MKWNIYMVEVCIVKATSMMADHSLVYLFYGIPIPYGLFNAEI